VLSAYTQSVLHRPMSSWFFGPDADKGVGQGAPRGPAQVLRGETGARIGGNEEVPLGQVPKSIEGRRKDIEALNALVRETYELAIARKLIGREQAPPRPLGPEDVKLVIADFFLGSDAGTCTHVRADTLATLLQPPHLRGLSPRIPPPANSTPRAGGTAVGGTAVGGTAAADSCQSSCQSSCPLTVGGGGGDWPGDDTETFRSGGGRRSATAGAADKDSDKDTKKAKETGKDGEKAGGGLFADMVERRSGSTGVCGRLARNQESRRVQLRVYDLLTAFPDRWLDSVVIDAYIHLLQEHSGLRGTLYINSAEQDPSLAEIRQTPGCFSYIICPLFYRSHWTVIFISHVSKRIRYLNSQVVDKNTPEFQTRPFAEIFPDYKVSMLTPTKQCDQSSCGVLACIWAHIFLYYKEEEMDRIKCPDIDLFRKVLLQQLILSYILLNRSVPH
jgi:hypothetical protein